MFGWSYPAGCSSTPFDIDMPETCPCCGGSNFDEDAGVELYKPDPAFCSEKCALEYANREMGFAQEFAEQLLSDVSE